MLRQSLESIAACYLLPKSGIMLEPGLPAGASGRPVAYVIHLRLPVPASRFIQLSEQPKTSAVLVQDQCRDVAIEIEPIAGHSSAPFSK